ncbi:MAG: glycosyltransferase family 2 protein [Coxiellaceae bacterium]|nr:glycosyltransferase family 2 protein [Coxiellaceae bacterium]
MSKNQKSPKICILMGTYNGEAFLKEQLLSFVAQTHQNWVLYISDDGSKDNTLEIVRDFQKEIGDDRVFIVEGPRKGFCANFLSLICNEEINGDYYAFSDQDDVWEPNKLARALECIAGINKPALYGARTLLTNKKNEPIGFSTLYKRKPSFQNALVQSIASANTITLNNTARDLLKKYSKNIDVVSHDWWAYQVITGCGGVVFYDPLPTLRYRQHDNNAIGRNDTLRAKLYRISQLFDGDFKKWNDQSIQALLPLYLALTPENKNTFDLFCKAKKESFIKRIFLVKKSGVYRQTGFGNLGIWVAVLLNKL